MLHPWVAVVVAAVCLPIAAQSGLRGNAAGTGDFNAAPLRANPTVAWEARLGFRDYGPMVLSEGIVVTGNITGKGGTFALDAASGKRLWSLPGALHGAPAADATSAYTVNALGVDRYRLTSAALRTGKPNWSVEGEKLGNQNGPPLVSDGRLYLLSDNGLLNAFEAASGKPIWELRYAPTRGECPTAISLSDGMLFFGAGAPGAPPPQGPFLWAVDAATGKEIWRYRVKDPSAYGGSCVTAPAVSGDTVVTTGASLVVALDARTGKLKWQQEVRRTVEGRNRLRDLAAVVVAGGVAYTFLEEGIAGYDLSSGKPVFDFKGDLPQPQYGANSAIAGGVLFFLGNLELPRPAGTCNGYLYALDLSTKQILWKHRVNRDSPYESIARWGSRSILPFDNSVFYENESILVKLK